MRRISAVNAELERRGLASYANSTRRRRLFSQLADMKTRARLKPLLDCAPSGWSDWVLPVDGYFGHLEYGPVPFREIEWVEFDSGVHGARASGSPVAASQVNRGLGDAAVNAGLLVTSECGYVRVWGYR